MLFQTLQFIGFFLPVFMINLLATNVLRSIRLRKGILVAASSVFYMTWSVPLFGLLVGSILINFWIGSRIAANAGRAKSWMTFGVVVQLGILGVFKYANFGIEAAAEMLSLFGFSTSPVVLSIVLPLGISFYTFQGMSYMLDLYRRRYAPYESFLDYFLYISFFPQLVAGPIVRADFFLERLKRIDRPIELGMVNSGAMLFVAGVFKKAVLADNASKIANLVFADPGEFSSLLTLLGLYAFAFQIYFDFSGYTDMARGLGRMLGIELPFNFNLPYLSKGLRDFWQRWHISLSTWLRDYLYISLGGNRVGEWRMYRNLIVTMLLGGLWHGASLNFVIWGGIHGGVLALEHATLGKGTHDAEGAIRNAIWIFVTFHLVCLAWIFFRADDFASSMTFLGTLTDLGGYTAVSELGYFKPQNWLFGLILPAIVVFGLEKRLNANEISLELRRPFLSAVGFCVLLFMILLASGDTNEFVYFQF